MGSKECKCYACDSEASSSKYGDRNFYECPVCGRYEIGVFDEDSDFNPNHLASYLLYHSYAIENTQEYRYHTTKSKELCDMEKKELPRGNKPCRYPVHMNSTMIENWYPKTIAEKVDCILLYIAKRTVHMGATIVFSYKELLGMLFIDHLNATKKENTNYGKWQERSQDDCENEIEYFLNYLSECNYVKVQDGPNEDEYVDLTLMPKGYIRVEEIQKNTAYGRNVLVAMKFGNDTKELREEIRKGIESASYVATFIDEVPHNGLITPELLKQIRDSKFVVVELTHQNNGAYFEEGYALGLGKPVIQLCRKGATLHFDIAQINTIMWEKETDIAGKLEQRIKATID